MKRAKYVSDEVRRPSLSELLLSEFIVARAEGRKQPERSRSTTKTTARRSMFVLFCFFCQARSRLIELEHVVVVVSQTKITALVDSAVYTAKNDVHRVNRRGGSRQWRRGNDTATTTPLLPATECRRRCQNSATAAGRTPSDHRRHRRRRFYHHARWIRRLRALAPGLGLGLHVCPVPVRIVSATGHFSAVSPRPLFTVWFPVFQFDMRQLHQEG